MADYLDALVSAGLMTKEQAEAARQAAVSGSANKPKKSGTYTRVQTSSNIPDDLALEQKINQVFKQFYGRDANQNELAIWLPQLKNKYKSHPQIGRKVED
jgi:hypothetical protein